MPVAPTQPVYPPSAGQPIEALWGDNVSDRTLQPFVNIADRDAKWTAPPRAALAATLDTDIIWFRTASGWIAMWGAPAYVGPRTDAGGNTEARFGNQNANAGTGYIALPDGSLQGLVANGTQFKLWERTADNTSHLQYASFGRFRSTLDDIGIGYHPVWTTYRGIWQSDLLGGNDYVLLMLGGGTFLNGGASVSIRAGGIDRMTFDTSNINYSQAQLHALDLFQARLRFFGYGWNYAQVIINPTDANATPHLSMIGAGAAAPQIFVNQAFGERFHFMDNAGTGYVPLSATAFTVSSAAATKRDVRPLRVEREHLRVVPLDRMADRAAVPNIMDLRPVAFRPMQPALRLVKTGEGDVDPTDPTSFKSEPHDPTAWLGHEGVRERLGLVADEVQHVIPSAVHHDENGEPHGIDYAQITVALLDHVQMLTEEVRMLRGMIADPFSVPVMNSDYRLKNEAGPITNPLERVAALRPIRFAWTAAPDVEQDGFLAHEVAEVVPEAVTGEKDAVSPEPPMVVQPDGSTNPDPFFPPAGQMIPQQLDERRIVPLLVAAVQELIAEHTA